MPKTDYGQHHDYNEPKRLASFATTFRMVNTEFSISRNSQATVSIAVSDDGKTGHSHCGG